MLGAVASVAGSLGAAGISGAFGASQASKNRAFQERMANTQYQRAVKDMRKAGLNPILAAGGGASVPSGSMAPGVSVENPTSAVSANRLKREEAENAKKQGENLAAMNDQIKAQTAKTIEEGRLTGANADQAEVMKVLYRQALPFVREAEKWINSSQKGAGGPGAWLKGVYDSLINSGSDALYKWDPMNIRSGSGKKKKSGSGSGSHSYRLKPIQVK